MGKLFATYNYELKEFNFSTDYKVIEEENALLIVLGNPSIKEKEKSLLDLLKLHKEKTTEYLYGLYIILFWDKLKKELLIIQDVFGFIFPIYYAENNGNIYFSISLKELLLNSGIERNWNELAISEFIRNGFIASSSTLIEGVNKLDVYNALKIENNKTYILPVSYDIPLMDKNLAKENWYSILDTAIDKACDNDDLNMSLSSGFDSNYILNYLRKSRADIPINAFSVGGVKGRNEVPAVKEILKHYKNVHLNTFFVDDKTLQHFPDIVWRLEGSVYEAGIFLQYALGRVLQSKKLRSLISGEGADQIFSDSFYNCYKCRKLTKADSYYLFQNAPYEMFAFCVLKKSGLIMDSFAIKVGYPYLDADVVTLGYALRCENGNTKAFHKEKCFARLDCKIASHIRKIGGATTVGTLFSGKKDKSKIRRISSAFIYAPSKLKMILFSLRSLYINALEKYKKRKNYKDVSVLDLVSEDVMDKYLVCTYLVLFEKLFMSKEYDSYFLKESFDKTLDDLFC